MSGTVTYNNNNVNTSTSTATNNNINTGDMTNRNINTSTSTSINTNNSTSVNTNNNVNTGTMTYNNNNNSTSTANNVNTNNNVQTGDMTNRNINQTTATTNNNNTNVQTGDMTNRNINQSTATSTNTNINQNNNTNINQNVQTGDMTNRNINETTITQRVIQPPPTAIAPAMMSGGGADLCTTGASGALQTQMFGMALGGTQRDLNCERLKLSKTLFDMGMKVAAVATMCQDRRVWEAMMAAGTPCPYEGKIGDQAKDLWQANPEKIPQYDYKTQPAEAKTVKGYTSGEYN